MSEMVERVAKSIFREMYQRADPEEIWKSHDAGDILTKICCMRLARAAIEAMREPTPRMMSVSESTLLAEYAAHPEWEDAKDMAENFDTITIWRAMIGAALRD